jgi:hypothetical protein
MLIAITCHVRQLSPSPEKCQLSFRYLAQASVGRKISDAGNRETPGYRREWQGASMPRRLDMNMEGFWHCALLCLCFSRQLFPQNQKVIRRLDPKANLISPDLHHHDSYLVPNENFIVFLQGQN